MLKKKSSQLVFFVSLAFALSACSANLIMLGLRFEIINQLELSTSQIPYVDQVVDDIKPFVEKALITTSSNRVLWKALFKSKKDLKSESLLSFPEKYIRIYQQHKVAIAASVAAFYNELTPEQRKKIQTLLHQYREKNLSSKNGRTIQKKDIPLAAKKSKDIFIDQIGVNKNTPQMQKLSKFIASTQKIAAPSLALITKQQTIWDNAIARQQDIESDFIIQIIDPYIAFFDQHKHQIAMLFTDFYNSLDTHQRENFTKNLDTIRQQFRDNIY